MSSLTACFVVLNGSRTKALRQCLSQFRPLRPAIRAQSYSNFYPQQVNGERNPRLDRGTVTWIGAAFVLILGGNYVAHLETAPETGRRRFMAVSEEEEALAGRMALEDTLQGFRGRILPFDHPVTLQVRRVTRRILSASNLGHLEGDRPAYPVDVWRALAGADVPRPPNLHAEKEWVVLVINDRRFINAFAAPGLVCISTGIMALARDEDGLAAIIGHEIGHVAMRHVAEHLSEGHLFMPLATLLLAFGIGPWIWAPFAKFFYSLPHSRALETEADIVGLKLMARACYDPGAAPRVFEHLRTLEKDDVPRFLNTHPPTLERVAHLKSLLPQNYAVYRANPECARLEEMRARGLVGRIRMNLNTGAVM